VPVVLVVRPVAAVVAGAAARSVACSPVLAALAA